MKKYVAAKPVRFDRDYAVGEIIPEEVVTPSAAKRLVKLGRIAEVGSESKAEVVVKCDCFETCVGLFEYILGVEYDDETPDVDERIEACKAAYEDSGDDESDGTSDDEPQNPPPETSGGEFICPVCEKPFANKAGLASHMKTHPDYKPTEE